MGVCRTGPYIGARPLPRPHFWNPSNRKRIVDHASLAMTGLQGPSPYTSARAGHPKPNARGVGDAGNPIPQTTKSPNPNAQNPLFRRVRKTGPGMGAISKVSKVSTGGRRTSKELDNLGHPGYLVSIPYTKGIPKSVPGQGRSSRHLYKAKSGLGRSLAVKVAGFMALGAKGFSLQSFREATQHQRARLHG